MAKPGKPAAESADPDREMKLAIVGALFFAVRLFKESPHDQVHRDYAANASALDAKALLDAVDRIE